MENSTFKCGVCGAEFDNVYDRAHHEVECWEKAEEDRARLEALRKVYIEAEKEYDNALTKYCNKYQQGYTCSLSDNPFRLMEVMF